MTMYKLTRYYIAQWISPFGCRMDNKVGPEALVAFFLRFQPRDCLVYYSSSNIIVTSIITFHCLIKKIIYTTSIRWYAVKQDLIFVSKHVGNITGVRMSINMGWCNLGLWFNFFVSPARGPWCYLTPSSLPFFPCVIVHPAISEPWWRNDNSCVQCSHTCVQSIYIWNCS